MIIILNLLFFRIYIKITIETDSNFIINYFPLLNFKLGSGESDKSAME